MPGEASEGVWGESTTRGTVPWPAQVLLASQGRDPCPPSALSPPSAGCPHKGPLPSPPVGRARGSGPRLPGAGGKSPPDGSGVGHESLRFSFSEQRVSLNCL